MLRSAKYEDMMLPRASGAPVTLSVPEYRARRLYAHPADDAGVSRLYTCWHRTIDIAFALVGLLVLLLVLPLVALMIRLDSPGPIFYRQARLGYRRRPLAVLKFRSMRSDAEADGGAVWAARGDPRVTRVGRFLRTSHLDELPQVLNILRGEMSLIGPRPERGEFAREIEETNPLFRHRLMVKPGLTGWAQVNNGYAGSSDESLEKLAYDLYYIEHRSIRLDVKIILKTVAEVVTCHGL